MSTKVEVHLRCRPVPDGAEQVKMSVSTNAGGTTLSIAESRDLAVDGTAAEKEYQLDGMWPGTTSQAFIFENIALPIADKVLDGYNGTICCYGATGSGKSFTTFGEKNNEGMVTRTIKYLFQQRQAREGSAEIRFVVSFLELYLDNTYDLLDDKPSAQGSATGSFGSTRQLVDPDLSSTGADPSVISSATPGKQSDSKILQLRETAAGAVYAEGLSAHPVSSADAMLALLKKGINRRVTFATAANERSSRSHAIFSVAVVQNDRVNGTTRSSVLTFADLAGSERLSKSASDGTRKLEAASINRSLSALGNVVQALAKNLPHIPYRDSKLTRILQHALGGSCHTTMICTVYPLKSNYDETLSTIQFAHRCRNIINQPRVSIIDLSSADLESKIRRLTSELADARTQLSKEEEVRKALQSRMNEMIEVLKETGEYTIGPNGEIIDEDGNLIIGARPTSATAGSRANSTRQIESSDHIISSPKRRRSASRTDPAKANKALQNSLNQVQAKLDQRSNDLLEVQAQSRQTKEALLKQINDQKQQIWSLTKELNAATQKFDATVEKMQKQHDHEIKRLIADTKELYNKNTELINSLPRIAQEYAEESRDQAELESKIRCALESEKSTFAVELDCMMINQREELTKHFQYELNILQMRLKEVEENNFLEREKLMERFDKLLQICMWFQKEYGRSSNVIHECCEGKHAAVIIGGGSQSCSRPQSRPATGNAPKTRGGSAYTTAISDLTETVEGSECKSSGVQYLYKADGQTRAASSVIQSISGQQTKSILEGSRELPSDEQSAGLSASVAGYTYGGTAAHLPGYVQQAPRHPSQHAAIVLPLELMPVPIPLDYVTFLRSEYEAREHERERLAAEATGPVSPPRGGTPIVTTPSMVTPSKPVGSVGLNMVRPYSNYTAKPYEYALSSSGTVKKIRPKTAPKPEKFIASLGSPSGRTGDLPATRIVDNLNTYSLTQTQRTRSGSILAQSKLNSLSSLGRTNIQRPSSTSVSKTGMLNAKAAQGVVYMDSAKAPSSQASQVSASKKKAGDELALSNLHDSPCLNISSINSVSEQPSNLTTEQLLRFELEREKKKTQQLQQAAIYQQHLLNSKIISGVDKSLTRQSRIEIYHK